MFEDVYKVLLINIWIYFNKKLKSLNDRKNTKIVPKAFRAILAKNNKVLLWLSSNK